MRTTSSAAHIADPLTIVNGTRSGSDSFDSGFGLAAGVRYSFARTGDAHGFLLGGEVVGAQASYGGTGHLTDYGLRLDGGYGYALDDRWSINLLIRGGYGRATLDIGANSTFSAISVSGGALTYGASLGVDAVVAERWHRRDQGANPTTPLWRSCLRQSR